MTKLKEFAMKKRLEECKNAIFEQLDNLGINAPKFSADERENRDAAIAKRIENRKKL
jgi:hypothetical protein